MRDGVSFFPNQRTHGHTTALLACSSEVCPTRAPARTSRVKRKAINPRTVEGRPEALSDICDTPEVGRETSDSEVKTILVSSIGVRQNICPTRMFEWSLDFSPFSAFPLFSCLVRRCAHGPPRVRSPPMEEETTGRHGRRVPRAGRPPVGHRPR